MPNYDDYDADKVARGSGIGRVNYDPEANKDTGRDLPKLSGLGKEYSETSHASLSDNSIGDQKWNPNLLNKANEKHEAELAKLSNDIDRSRASIKDKQKLSSFDNAMNKLGLLKNFSNLHNYIDGLNYTDEEKEGLRKYANLKYKEYQQARKEYGF